MVEKVLHDYDHAYGLKYIALRYFNAAGADDSGEIGESHDPETHLIPLALKAIPVASRHGVTLQVFGTDYPTPDGTCVRDYIHINDLCEAHSLALKYIQANDISVQYNLGNGKGFSVQQVIDSVREVTGKEFKVTHDAKRPGDPAVLVADSTLAQKQLGWKPEHTDLGSIIKTAWNWETEFLSK